ncbi:hypothetical protein [Terriglobus sp.]|uniref:hypothetical protein n=1 Tax=Terriglobus sp. TaxID=1889013 RepID=UPI003B00EE99
MNAPACRTLLLLAALLASGNAASAQATAPSPSSEPANQAASQQANDTASELQKPSTLIAPAVDHLSQVVSQVELERWKGSSRDETDSNLRSVERNVSTTLPQLVTAADAQPASIAASLPLLRNLDALCAVMIRVSVTARANAPTPQAESLNGALTALQSARNTLADQVQTLAAAQEKQLASQEHVIAFLKDQAISKQAAATTPPPPATKPKPRKKSPVKPAAKPVQ